MSQAMKKPAGGSPARLFFPVLIGAFALGAASNYIFKVKHLENTPEDSSPNPSISAFKTTGVSNIEKAYTGAGATGSHTPGYGGTPRGDRGNMTLKEGDGASGGKQNFETRNRDGEKAMGEELRPRQSSVVGQKFNEMKYGSQDQK